MSGKFVGIRTTIIKRVRGEWYDLHRNAMGVRMPEWRWRVVHYIETTRKQLHSTKGWKHISTTRETIPRNDWICRPEVAQSFERYPGDWRPWRDVVQLTPEQMERARMRHPWYRRQKQMEAFRASLPAENRLDAEVAA